jgi:hypothetical protein
VLKIHETTTAAGAFASVALDVRDDTLVLVDGGAERALPSGSIPAVLRRFGAPIEPETKLNEIARLALPDGGVLRHVRHLARFDVIGKDWLVWEPPAGESLIALATTVAGALAHLAKAT